MSTTLPTVAFPADAVPFSLPPIEPAVVEPPPVTSSIVASSIAASSIVASSIAASSIAASSIAASSLANASLATPNIKAERIHLGPLAIDTYAEQALADHVLDHAFNGGRTRQIVTANAQFYVLAEKNQRFRECLDAAEYICADGMPIVWACERFTGIRVPRITGVDFIGLLCQRGARDGLRVFLLGGRPGTAQATADKLKEQFPGVVIAGVDCPDWGFETSPATLNPVLDRIAAAKPHILLAGLGAPKQEFFIHEHIRPLKVPIAIGIGGSFEILSGSLKRAPTWIQSHGFEWAFRLTQEPRRLFSRYLVGNAEFLWDLAKWRLRESRRPAELGTVKGS
jgi:N-acetylglucosaminyldiphosphoundecaprenol N-acetyl-beta-D-mannosaminyltransferase